MFHSRQKSTSLSQYKVHKFIFVGHDTWMIHGYSKNSIPITTCVKPIDRSLCEIFDTISETELLSDQKMYCRTHAQKIEDELNITRSMVFGHMPEQKAPTLELITFAPNSFRDIYLAEMEAERIGKICDWRKAYLKDQYEQLRKGYGLAGYMTFTYLSLSDRLKNLSVKGRYRTNRLTMEKHSAILKKQLHHQIKRLNYITEDIYTKTDVRWIQTARVLAGLGFQGVGVSTFNHEMVLAVVAEKFPKDHTINEIWEARAGHLSEDGTTDYDPRNHLVDYYCTKHGGQLLVDKDLQPIVFGQKNKFMNVLIVSQKDLVSIREKYQKYRTDIFNRIPFSRKTSRTILHPGFIKAPSFN